MKRFARPLTAVFIVLSVSSLAPGQSLQADPQVQKAVKLVRIWLEAQRAYQQIPGLSAAVVHDQQVLWSEGFGYADLARKTPATPSTIYSVCSISKLFTSIAVMQQRDAGKLRLDDPVGRHLSWFAIKRSDPKAPEITIEGFLTHSSGLPREAAFPYWTGPEFNFPSRDQVIQRIAGQETLYPAETYFQYSNLGMALAGEVVAAASGQPYDQYVRRHILEPLGLRSTSPEMPEKERAGKLAVGYSAPRREGSRVPVTFFLAKGIAPAAGYASTAEDLARFASWQFRVLARKGGEDVLSSNTLREMQRVHWMDNDFQTSWGLGFSVWRNDNKTFVGHGGSCPGFRSQLLLKPDEKVAVVIMANAQGVDAGDFAKGAYEIIAPAIKAALKETDAKTKKPAPDLSRYTGCYETGFAGEVAIIEWEDGLAAVPLPTMTPMQDLAKFKKVGEHSFRRVRKDEALGETIVFEMGADGKASRISWHNNEYRRTR